MPGTPEPKPKRGRPGRCIERGITRKRAGVFPLINLVTDRWLLGGLSEDGKILIRWPVVAVANAGYLIDRKPQFRFLDAPLDRGYAVRHFLTFRGRLVGDGNEFGEPFRDRH